VLPGLPYRTKKSVDFGYRLAIISGGGNAQLMHLNRELPRAKSRNLESCRVARPPKNRPETPQITIRGDNNLINLGASGIVKVSSGLATPSLQTPRNGYWPQQLLDAIRVKAARNRRSNEQICELAGRVLGRPVVTLEKLAARELARVYEAVCASEANG
jgi:hypothetical protein